MNGDDSRVNIFGKTFEHTTVSFILLLQFILSGQNYHRIGSLIPHDGCFPKFNLLYIYDTLNEVSNRLNQFR